MSPLDSVITLPGTATEMRTAGVSFVRSGASRGGGDLLRSTRWRPGGLGGGIRCSPVALRHRLSAILL